MTHKIVVIEGGKRVEQPTTPPPADNTAFMLGWCRANIPGFKDCEARALAAKGGGKAGK